MESTFRNCSALVEHFKLNRARTRLRRARVLLVAVLSSCLKPRSRQLRTQKLKSYLTRTQSLKVLPLKLGVGQDIAMHDTLIVRDFFLANFYPSGPFTCIFSKTVPSFFSFFSNHSSNFVHNFGTQNQKTTTQILVLFIFRKHSTRETASSRVTSFILRAYAGTGVSRS